MKPFPISNKEEELLSVVSFGLPVKKLHRSIAQVVKNRSPRQTRKRIRFITKFLLLITNMTILKIDIMANRVLILMWGITARL
jgi:hypothetical protein